MVKKAVKQTNKTTAKSAAKKSARRPVKSSARHVAIAKKQPAANGVSLAHRLDSLLHTMRCIAQHEDELCTLLHDARRSGKVSGKLLRELHTLLDELPAEEYTFDLDAVREMVTGIVAA